MVCFKLTFILFCCVFRAYTSNINETEQYEPHISAILKHLNSNPNKIYDYKKGILVNSQQKADIFELTIDVDVTCIVNYPGVPCTEQVLTCNGFVQNSDGQYRVLSDVLCNPKQDASVESLNDGSTIPTRSQHDSKIDLSHEAVPSNQNADFVAVKPDTAPCVGCPFDLNTDIEGTSSLVDTALRHIETEKTQKHIAVKVIRLQQQVVAGIKYFLIVEVAPTVCQKHVDLYSTNCPLDGSVDSSVCEIIFLQRPWLSKDKLIIGNNCTTSQKYPPESIRNQRDDMSNEINTNSDVNKNKVREMNSQRLADLESQILLMEPENTKPFPKDKVQANSFPKKIQYEEVIGNPTNNQLYTTYKVQNENYEPVAVTHGQSTNAFSTATEKNVNTENSNRESSDISNSENGQTDSTTDPLNENGEGEKINENKNDDINLQETRPKREVDDSDSDSSESKEDKVREPRDLANSNSDSSESHEEEREEVIRPKRNTRGKDDADGTSESESKESSETHEDNKTEESHHRRRQDLENSDSDSSGSHEDEREAVRHKRGKDDADGTSESESKESSETHEDNKTQESHHRRRRDLQNSDSDSSESHQDEREAVRPKRDARRKDDADGTSESESKESSETHEDNKTEEFHHRRRRDLENSDSDSSGSHEDERQAVRHKRGKDDADGTSESESKESSETHEDNKTQESHHRRRRDLQNSDSDSSESHQDEREAVRPKKDSRGKDDADGTSESESKESSETHEDNKTEESHHRRRRDLENSDSDSSESHQDEKEAVRPKRGTRGKDDADGTSESERKESSETHEDNKTEESHHRQRRDLENSDSDSSESHQDEREAVRPKRDTRGKDDADDTSESESKESSEAHEDNKTQESHHRRRRDLQNSDSDSSESHEDGKEKAIRLKRNAGRKDEDSTSESDNKQSSESHEDNKSQSTKSLDLENSSNSNSSESEQDKRGESLRSTDNSNSSSSSSSEDKSKQENRIKRESNNKVDSSSSSSSSSDDESKEKNKHENGQDNSDSSSSSNSSKDKSKEQETNNNDSSSSSSSSDESKKKNKKTQEDDSSDSSSSSNSSKSKSKEQNRIEQEANNNDSSSSSSSSDESKENNKKTHEDDNSDSSSSSSSSEENSREQNRIKHNTDDVNVEVRINKVKRSVGQLEKITQEEKFLVRDLADFAAFSLDNIDDDNHKRVILQILSAKKLKLDGIYYHIILRLGISQCSENEDDENCREKLFPDLTKICKVLVHVEDDLSNPKVVKSQCQNTKKDDRDRNRTNYSRYRRNTLVGAPSNIALDDPRILEFTKDTLTELDAKSEHPNRHKVNKIVSATSQVVAGAKYKIKMEISLSDCLKTDAKPLEDCDFPQNTIFKVCDIVVWDRPWLHQRQTTVKCDDSEKEYYFENKSRKNRSYSNQIIFDKDDLGRSINNKENLRPLGGIEEQSPDNLKALKYLKDILAYLDNESGHYNKLKVQDIISVDKQVVAGELWRIKATVTLSDCPQNKSVDPQDCKELEGSESRTCVFKIWDRPWLPNGREVQTSCENESVPYSFRLKRSLGTPRYIIPGSLDETNEPNPKVLHYVKSGLQYLDSRSPHSTKYTIKNIKKVSKQAVPGQFWRVTAEIVLSDCPKRYYTQYCEELEDSKSKICYFTIWEQPWLSNSLQINITCENDDNLYSFSPKSTQHINTFHNQELLVKFNDFMIKHNKTYLSDTEYNYRLKVFKDNLNTIKLLNNYEQGTAQYGVTQFADLTATEFSKSHGLRPDLRNENEPPFSNAIIPDIELPTAYDWRQKNVVTKVKNQGMCGSCWAFSTTGNIEGQYAIKYGKLLEFSEQELVDCDKLDEGCNGGLMDNAYRTIEQLGGLETESDYPYEGDDEKCHFVKSEARVQLSGALNISHNEVDMAKWLVKNGPISIAINANAMQFYFGGVSHPWKALCNPKSLDHGVLIVGYGVDNYPKFNKTLPFWIVKNSWGTSWGEQGYYRVYRGDGTCGLNQTPSSAIVA